MEAVKKYHKNIIFSNEGKCKTGMALRFHLTPVRAAMTRENNLQRRLAKLWGKGTLSRLVRLEAGSGTLESSMKYSQEAKHLSTV